MISRFDHVVIAVGDLSAAVDNYRSLGFDVAAGGRHESLGTHNAIIRFGLDYIELLAVEDEALARQSGAFAKELAEYLAHSTGLVGFALASSGLEQEANGFKNIEQFAEGPFLMDRLRPDARRLSWRLLVPGGTPWRKPWPFLIEWHTPDEERLQWDASGDHDNGSTGVAGLDLLVDDLTQAREIYETACGLQPIEFSDSQVHYQIGDFDLIVGTPSNEVETEALAQSGPGPYRLRLRGKPSATGPNELSIEVALGTRITIG